MKIIFFRRMPRRYLGFALGFFLLLVLLPSIIKLLATENKIPQAIYIGNSTKPQVAFACNVFWGEEFLPQMLDTFDKSNVKATFFIGGKWAKKYPEMLKEIARRGHELGNHSFDHPHPNALNKEQNKDQIKQTDELIYELTGKRTTLYEPPYGEFNNTVLLAASDLGYRTIMWTIDTVDWKRPPQEVIINRVMKKLQNGAIILIHPTDPTAKALPDLIKQIQEKGYSIVPVSTLLQ